VGCGKLKPTDRSICPVWLEMLAGSPNGRANEKSPTNRNLGASGAI